MKARKFPVQASAPKEPQPPAYVPWGWVERFESRIWKNHQQGIGDLARCGGLDAVELFMAAFDLDVGAMRNVSIAMAVLWLRREPWKKPRGR